MTAALTRKLLRDLVRLRGQALTIALVVASGVASYVATAGTWASLSEARDSYYERYRLPHVFAGLTRAPESLAARIESIPGVQKVYTRVVEHATIPIATLPEPASGKIVTLPVSGVAPLDAVHILAGRGLTRGRGDEVLISDAFARAHGLVPGSAVPVILDGRRQTLRVVGIAGSPENVFIMTEGFGMPNDRRTAVVWMSRPSLAAATRMEGLFNEVVLRLQPGASERSVIRALDRLLEPYGGKGAYGQDRHPSARMVAGEITQVRAYGVIMPAIFLGVAAFLLNVVLSRVVELQRGQIAVLKALGYTGREVGAHYLAMISLICFAGALLGIPIGVWVGEEWTNMYHPYFRFPSLEFRVSAGVIAGGILFCVGFALVGAMGAVRRVARLPPAEAMNPPAPPPYGASLAQRIGVFEWVGNSSRMVLREAARRPVRPLLSSLGIAAAMAVVVSGSFQFDLVDEMMDLQFGRAMVEDMSVTFRRAVPASALSSLRALPGVRLVEGARAVPVRFTAGHLTRDGLITGHMEDETLRRVIEQPGRNVPVEGDGLVVSRVLADRLRIGAGDEIDVEVLEGEHEKGRFRVSRLIDDMGGLNGHAPLGVVSALLREEPAITNAYLSIDPQEESALQASLRGLAGVGSVWRRQEVIDAVHEQTGRSMILFSTIITAFAATIAVAVVYNNARVALSARGRELASLRVLGFTRGEVAAILLGELALHLVVAIPIGIAFGKLFGWAMMSTIDPELSRFYFNVSGATYAFAVSVTATAAALSAVLVKRKLDQLDLVAVLKTKE